MGLFHGSLLCKKSREGFVLGDWAEQVSGRVVARLLVELPALTPDHLVDNAKVLNNFYIPARYPNGYPEGSPFEQYGSLQSEQAIRYAGMVDFVGPLNEPIRGDLPLPSVV